MSNRFFVITGATSGIGRATAETLGGGAARLILVGRNERAGKAVADRIQRQDPGATAEFIPADLSCQKDVRALARSILDRSDHVDGLINNAGARFDEYSETTDGIERTFATNHLGHFLLTSLLTDALCRAPSGRVITVASGSHSSAKADGEWQCRQNGYDRRQAYAKSKLANVMFAYELAERLRHTRVTSNGFDPGGVATNFARNNGLGSWLRHLTAHALKRNLASPRRASDGLVFLATSSAVAGVTGRYFHGRREVESSSAAHDREAARRLWELSVQLTGAAFDRAPREAFA